MIKIQIKIIYITRYSDTVIHTYIYTYIYICIQYTQIDIQIPCCTETKYLSYQLPGTKKPVTLHSSWVPSNFTFWCTVQHLRLAIHHVDRHGYCGRTALFFCHKLQVVFFPVRSFGHAGLVSHLPQRTSPKTKPTVGFLVPFECLIRGSFTEIFFWKMLRKTKTIGCFWNGVFSGAC